MSEISKISLFETVKLRQRIKSLLAKIGLSSIPMSLIFESLGYSGIQGVGWGILSAIISMTAVELGFEVVMKGGRYYLEKKDEKNLAKKVAPST